MKINQEMTTIDIDAIIIRCNNTYMTRCIEEMNKLTDAERAALLAEWEIKPDSRYHDSLLSACSVVSHAGGGVYDVTKNQSFGYELRLRKEEKEKRLKRFEELKAEGIDADYLLRDDI